MPSAGIQRHADHVETAGRAPGCSAPWMRAHITRSNPSPGSGTLAASTSFSVSPSSTHD